jgi:hypothetical protein
MLVALWNTAAGAGPWRTVLFGMAVVFPFLLWRCGYLLLAGQHGRVAGTRFREHLIYLWPAYGGNNTPYGKGLDYLALRSGDRRTSRAHSFRDPPFGLAALWGGTLFAFERVSTAMATLTRFSGRASAFRRWERWSRKAATHRAPPRGRACTASL